ncbi:MAG: DUF5621 domain-containing protein, partial [Legionellaceae bacterium]
NIISKFSKACTAPKLILEGPHLLGTEVKPNIKKAVHAILARLNSAPEQDQYQVNMVGSSRGGITCLMIATALKKYTNQLRQSNENPALLKKLECLALNIFALDPVVGLGAKHHLESRLISDNVKNYIAFVQLDEMRRDFKPQDLSRIIVESQEKTTVTMLPMYGNHTAAIKIKDLQKTSTARMAWISLYAFLNEHGTVFEKGMPDFALEKKAKAPLTLSLSDPKGLLSLCNEQHKEREHYLSYGKRHKTGDSLFLRKQRRLYQHREMYVEDSDFFLNQWERSLFKMTYPRVFNYLFERNRYDPDFPSASSVTDVLTELKIMSSEHRPLFLRLRARGVGEEKGLVTVCAQPRGHLQLESCRVMMQLFPHLLPSTLTADRIKERASTVDLKNEIMMLMHRYRTEKPFFYVFEKRAQFNRTQLIIQTITHIMHDDENAKEERMLDCLVYHATFLKQVQHRSHLTDLLSEFLKRHGRDIDPLPVVSYRSKQMMAFIEISLALVKDTVYMIGSLGFVGGFVLSTVGLFLKDLGRRMDDMLGGLKSGYLKQLGSVVAYLLQEMGYILMQHLGLKPLTTAAIEKIGVFRDQQMISFFKREPEVEPEPVQRSEPKDDIKHR